ncbi:phage minor head protein [Flavobacterium sp. HSC-61S13]|uniref:phage head morphogenesis protein n=1 Tax=Flavobacterium sp. HSC-61S13 TaxID=2910963 RepID=UPI0020A02BEF|nr:phage minor head protein [Flavobacterium sp. HSC-61S13]MCP1997288.1 SPP1 gp7 family putative phage head morphogenesis protein [Flavobacterium sp. HSC-61S13]
MPQDNVYHPIVEKQGKEFSSRINQEFGAIDFDTPDYYMREVLKKNSWQFSVAKNYNDLTRLNNLLLREDGSLRPWNEFKSEAKKVVGDSMKYLKTEYDTVVSAAQMSRLWVEIQRDKEIFPFIQFVIVNDGRTSEICQPLYNVIVSVDDPILMNYFPPNHFNCRTTVKKLRYGVPSDNYELPEIPDAFKTNVGVSGEIFTKENRYIANTPDKVLKLGSKLYYDHERTNRYNNIPFEVTKIGKGILEIFTKGKQNKSEFRPNTETLTVLVRRGEQYRMLPVLNDGATNPDAYNIKTNQFVDIKVAQGTNGKNIVQSAMKEASKQNVQELIIRLKKQPDSYRKMYEALRYTVSSNRAKNIKVIIVVFPDNSVKEYNIGKIRRK